MDIFILVQKYYTEKFMLVNVGLIHNITENSNNGGCRILYKSADAQGNTGVEVYETLSDVLLKIQSAKVEYLKLQYSWGGEG